VVKAKMNNVRGGRMWEPHFRPQERLEDLELERHNMEFLFDEGDTCTFMRPDTFEQVEVPNPVLGLAARFLQPGMELPVEFVDGHPITVVFSDVAEARVVDTAPPSLAFTVAG
jgi:elongation factor P